jgi:mono/diheme cytochrome c family protein
MVLFFSSCYYDKEDLLYGTSSCDTTNVKYSTQIVGIINSSCISCHGGTAAAGGGIKLGDYASVKAAADNGTLLNSVIRTNNTMPKGGARLSNCRISEIRTWIRNGTLNN